MVLVAAAALLRWAAALDCNCSAPPANLHAYDSLIIGDATATAYGREAARINLNLSRVLAAFPNAGNEDACATSAGLVACLDPYLARPWRAVHVNYGREDARRNVSAADYAQNLETLRDMLLARTTWKLTWASSVPRGVPDVRRLDAAAERVFERNASFDDLSAVLDTNCRLENGSGYPETAGCPRLQHGDGALKPRGASLLGLQAAASTLAISAAAAEINDVHDEGGSSSSDGDEGLPEWAFVGISYSTCLLFVGVAGTVALFWRRRKRRRIDDDEALLEPLLVENSQRTHGVVFDQRSARVREGGKVVCGGWCSICVLLAAFWTVLLLYHFPLHQEGDHNCASRCPADANVLFGDNAVDANYSKPNVLFVGDSISGQIEPQARRLLAAHDLGTTLFASTGKDGYCGTSVGLLACVDPYLAAGNFTVAHVNWGMRDIAWKMYAKVTRGAYAAHMETLYWKLRSSMPPNATIIWATTTPVPPSYDNRKNSDVLEVNDIIRSLFGPAGKYREVIINDQYGTLVDACASRRNASDCFPETCDCPEVHKHEDIHLSELGARALGVAAAAKVATYRAGHFVQSAPWTDRRDTRDRDTWQSQLTAWQLALLFQAMLVVFAVAAAGCCLAVARRRRRAAVTPSATYGAFDAFDKLFTPPAVPTSVF